MWSFLNAYDAFLLPADYQYGPAPGAVYPPQGDGYGYEAYPEAPPLPVEDLGPQPLTQADKDKGAASVFRRDDASLRQRDRDEREKDPGFVSDTYAECYPGYGVSECFLITDHANHVYCDRLYAALQ